MHCCDHNSAKNSEQAKQSMASQLLIDMVIPMKLWTKPGWSAQSLSKNFGPFSKGVVGPSYLKFRYRATLIVAL